MKFLNTIDDLCWIWETALKDFRSTIRIDYNIRSAIIHGNEDSPFKIELFTKENPSYKAKPKVIFTLQENGTYSPSIGEIK